MERELEQAVKKELDKKAKDAGIGAGAVASVALALVLVSKWSRWRGKRVQKKRAPEAPGFSLSIKRNPFGRRKYLAKYVA